MFFFLKALHDQADWYVVSLFLLLTQGFYFNSMNSVRYYFALALAMYAQKYVLRGEYGKFILWVLLGCTIHKSVVTGTTEKMALRSRNPADLIPDLRTELLSESYF